LETNWIQIIHKAVKSAGSFCYCTHVTRGDDTEASAACARYLYHCCFIIIVISAARFQRVRVPLPGWCSGAYRMLVGAM